MNSSELVNHGSSELPPPAYSEQAEFDHKVSMAVEISQQYQPEDDEWEPYDPQAFEAAASAYQNNTYGQGSMTGGGASTSMPHGKTSQTSTKPFPVDKKGAFPADCKSDYKGDTKKQDYGSSKQAADDQSQYGQSSSSSLNPSAAASSQPYIYNDCDGDDVAPPPFSELPPQAHQDPHTEYNPYDGFTPSARPAPLPPAINIRPPELETSTNSQGDQRLSPLYDLQQPSFRGPPPQLLPDPVQPMQSFGGPPPQFLPDPVQPSFGGPPPQLPPDPVRHQAYRQSMPSPPLNQPPMPFEHRPRSAMAAGNPPSSFPMSSPSAPSLFPNPTGQSTLRFRPSIAYNKKASRQPYVIPHDEPQPQAYSAASFYNAAVSSHMTPRPSASASYVHTPRPEQPGSWASSNRPESVYSMSSSYSDHTQSDAASQYGGFSQPMGYNWGNGYQR